MRMTDREELETLLEILFVVGLEGGSPCLEFGLEGHFLEPEGGKGRVGGGGKRRGSGSFNRSTGKEISNRVRARREEGKRESSR